MKNTTAPLMPGVFYHIFNRGNNRENLFIEQRNYAYFLTLYLKYIEPIADTYAYCLMKNHFHLLVRIKTEEEYRQYIQQQTTSPHQISPPPRPHRSLRPVRSDEVSGEVSFNPSKHFSNLFNAYAKTINKGYGRTGSLFEERFGRIPVTRNTYFQALIYYIHFNPQKHGFVADFSDWHYSSYQTILGIGQTRLKRDEILALFGDANNFIEAHQGMLNEKLLSALVDGTFDLETTIESS